MTSSSDESDICDTNRAWLDFEDMVYDWDRNNKYQIAIQEVIQRLQSQGKKANVLDIGSGTGLLSYFSQQAGATTVVGLEMDKVVYETSLKIARRNNMPRNLKFINTPSTLYETKYRSNVLVSEMLDSELIGENLISTYRDALERLVTDDVIAIPAVARAYVVPIRSDFARKFSVVSTQGRVAEDEDDTVETFHKLHGTTTEPQKKSVKKSKTAPSESECECDLFGVEGQWSRLTEGVDYRRLHDKVLVKEFNLTSLKSLQPAEVFKISLTLPESERVFDGFLFFWELDMLGDGRHIISTEPNASPWRNHWLPMIFPCLKPVHLEAGQPLLFHAFHDEVSFCFRPTKSFNANVRAVRNESRCAWHHSISPWGIYRCHSYEGATLPAHAFVRIKSENLKFHCVAEVPHLRKVINCYLKKPTEELVESIAPTDENQGKVQLVIADLISPPQDAPSTLAARVQNAVKHSGKGTEIFPPTIELKMTMVKLPDLSKRRNQNTIVNGLDYRDFVELARPPRLVWDKDLEHLPLWEYECEIVDTISLRKNFDYQPKLEVDLPEGIDALAFWNCGNDGNHVFCYDMVSDGNNQRWTRTSKQWIYFLRPDHDSKATITFTPGKMTFTVEA